MRKNIIITFLLLILVIPTLVVNAESISVHDEEELKNAISNASIDIINLANDIDTTAKITISRPLTLNGNGHTMKYVGKFGSSQSEDNKVWGGIYLLQVYRTTATIKNIKLTGGNAALLVNGGNVTLDGKIDVSGNGFGGIELAQGKGVTETVKLELTNDSELINTTESEDTPTMWVPSDSKNALVTINGIQKEIASGLELSLNEINSLFIVNPQTMDNIIIYIITAIISSLSIGVAVNTLRKEV